MSCSCLFSSLGFAACLPVLCRLAGFVPCPACICGLVAFVPFPRACCRRLVLPLACLYFVGWLVSCRILPVLVVWLLSCRFLFVFVFVARFAACLPVLCGLAALLPFSAGACFRFCRLPACTCGLLAFVPFPARGCFRRSVLPLACLYSAVWLLLAFSASACFRGSVLSLACLYFVAWLVSCRVLPVRVACLLCLVWLVCRPCSASICGFVPFLPFPVCVCLRRSVWPLACLYFVGWLVSRRLCRGRGFVFRLACLSCAAGACRKQENATREKDENSRRMRKKDVFEFAERFGSYSARCEHDEKPDPKRAIFPFFRLTP